VKLDSIFDRKLDFDPAGDIEAFLKSAPGKWVVYLLADADDQPLQLLCVQNLRYSLERRLGTADPLEGPSKRVNYRDIVRRVYYTRVDSDGVLQLNRGVWQRRAFVTLMILELVKARSSTVGETSLRMVNS